MTDEDLLTRLALAAASASKIRREMAEAKSLRQADNPERRTDLYMWPTPEQTVEGIAHARLTTLLAERDALNAAHRIAAEQRAIAEAVSLARVYLVGRPPAPEVFLAKLQEASFRRCAPCPHGSTGPCSICGDQG